MEHPLRTLLYFDRSLSTQVNIPNIDFGVIDVPHGGTKLMQYKGVEYTVIQMAGGTGWKWEVRFADGKSKSGVTPESRASAIKLAEFEIDRVVKDRK